MWANVTSAQLWYLKKYTSFEVKVTIGTKISPKLSAEGLQKDVMGAAIVPVGVTRALWLNILHFMLNCLESGELNQVPFPGPKVSSV